MSSEMPAEPKSVPIHAPRMPSRIIEGLRAAIANPMSKPRAYIRLSVSGGVHGEAYDFEYRIDANGQTSAHLRDELKDCQVDEPSTDTKAADPARFADLAAALDIEALVRNEAQGGRFPPDSVVGRLEVSDGEQTVTFLFLADEDQARQARLLVPDSLRKTVDTIYRAAAAYLGTENVRP